MKLTELFDLIESHEFQVQYAVLGGFRSVRLAMQRDETLGRLALALRQHGAQGVDATVARVIGLLSQPDHVPGASYDIAVTAYIHCLLQVDAVATAYVADHVEQDSGLWWAVEMASRVRSLPQSVSVDQGGELSPFAELEMTAEPL